MYESVVNRLFAEQELVDPDCNRFTSEITYTMQTEACYTMEYECKKDAWHLE